MTKRTMLVGFVVMALVIGLGVFWGKLFRTGYAQSEYGEELSKRDARIEELEDSLRVLRMKLSIYEEAAKWFRSASDDELQRGIKQIRNVPKDVTLP